MKNKWLLIALGAVVAGFVMLNLAGRLFISEVTQDVKIAPSKPNVADLNKPAPYFELFDLEGGRVKISDFLGKPLVITFWTTWNQDAAAEIKIYDDYLTQNKNPLFEIVAINSQEDRSVVSQFIKRGGYKVKVLLDENGGATESWRAHSLPTSYFLDKQGIIKDIFTGVLSEKMLVEKAEQILVK